MWLSPAHAKVRYYQYDGDIPFIEMMLNMMTVMGILDKIPVDYMHDIAYSRFNNPYPAVSTGPRWYAPYRLPSGAVNQNCRTILCGNRAELLNGLWVAQNGEMLGIKDNKFLWNDGDHNYLTGAIQVRANRIYTRPEGTDATVQYQYRINKRELLMRDQNGLVKLFKKVNFRDKKARKGFMGLLR